jgi:hypothetical protein
MTSDEKINSFTRLAKTVVHLETLAELEITYLRYGPKENQDRQAALNELKNAKAEIRDDIVNCLKCAADKTIQFELAHHLTRVLINTLLMTGSSIALQKEKEAYMKVKATSKATSAASRARQENPDPRKVESLKIYLQHPNWSAQQITNVLAKKGVAPDRRTVSRWLKNNRTGPTDA